MNLFTIVMHQETVPSMPEYITKGLKVIKVNNFVVILQHKLQYLHYK